MIPTYNEAGNITELLSALLKIEPAVHVLVIDDQSPDGTGELVQRLAEREPRVHLLSRSGPRGRGLAGIAGYNWALAQNAQSIIEMDADLSHRPEFVPHIIAALQRYQVVIGSRYVPGGQDRRRGATRRLISKLANAYTRFILGLPIRDCTSGFRGYRAEVLRGIGAERLTVWGPAVLSDVLWRIKLKRFSFGEIPIQFDDRQRGTSTLTTAILVEGLWNVLRLRLRVGPGDVD